MKKIALNLSVIMMVLVMIIGSQSVYAEPGNNVTYIERSWNGSQVVENEKTAYDVAWMTSGHLEWHNNWWYTRDLDELVISDRVSVDNDATANLILMDGKTIKFENGIHVGKGSTLNIYGQAQGTGKLIVGKSEADTAAIGGNAGESNGTINIYGGTIEVTGGSHSSNGGAGIGAGGTASNESSINIYGGNITSTGGANAAGIGGGARGGHGGAINIYGGNVTANGDSGAAGIGGGEGGSGTGTFIYGGEVHAVGGSTSADGGAGIGSGSKAGREGVVGGNVYVFGGSVYATGGADAAGIGGGNEVSGGYVEINGDGAYVEASSKTLGAGIGGGQNGDGGTVEIRKGTVNATGGSDAAGIGGGESGRGGTVNISGGEVYAQGVDCGAGIGSGDYAQGILGSGPESVSVTITISGGEVHAQGGTEAAGIGGGDQDSGPNLTITNGEVYARGGDYGAGIGSGDTDSRPGVFGGIIQIKGGHIDALGGEDAAGIGGGEDGDGAAVVRISGGEVNAEGSKYAAGIGGGEGGDGKPVVISGGTVKAKGGSDAAGIGGGDGGNGDNVEISEDDGPCEVYALGGAYGAGIGGGDGGEGGRVEIRGGYVEAQGGEDAAGIGGGEGGDGATVTIKGGTVKAWGDSSEGGSQGGAGIGSGDYDKDSLSGVPSAGSVTITGGEVHAYGAAGAAGIGGGNGVNGGLVNISGGEVYAQGGDYGAGIGGGDGINYIDESGIIASERGDAGEIEISGNARVTATGGDRAAGIGCGRLGETGTITIESGTVNAQGGPKGAGIGSGANNAEADDGVLLIDIKGGTVTAKGGRIAAGIGGGYKGVSGKITIAGGTVNAQGGVNGGAGIGCGTDVDNERAVNITIDGGTVTARAGVMHGDGGTEYMPGTAIGASGGEDGGSKFYGIINLNGGEITAYAPLVGITTAIIADNYATIGAGSRDNLKLGLVSFGGAHVTMYNELYRDDGSGNATETTEVIVPSVAANEFDIVEKCGDTHFHQRVRYKEDGSQENWQTALVGDATNFDERIIVLDGHDERRKFPVTEVLPCEHEDAVITDNGDGTHKVDCNTCKHVGDEDHTYGDPVWTWADDNSSATAKFTCTKCDNEKEVTDSEIDIDVVSEEKKTDEQGKTYFDATFTAKVTFNEKEYQDSKDGKKYLDPAEVTIPPMAKSLVYNASEQVLITEGTTTTGTMQYAVGTDGEIAPTYGWSEELPKEINAGVYYVWYKVLGDATHSDSIPQFVESEIKKAPAPAVEIPAPDAVTYDPEQTLADIELTEGWNWTNRKTVPTVPKEEYKAEISVDDVNYDYTGVDGYDPRNHTVTRAVPLTVLKAEVAYPEITSKVYNGKKQTASVPDNELYYVHKNDGGTDVGQYDVVLMLTDSNNYKWTDSVLPIKTLKFNITKALAPEVKIPALKAVTYDPAMTLTDIALPEGWAWTDDSIVPTVINDGYSAYIAVDDENYYIGVDGYDEDTHTVTRTIPLTVNKALVSAPEIASKVYNGEHQRADVEESALYTVIGNEGGTNVGEYDVELALKDTENYKWEESDEANNTLKFNITPAKAKTPAIPSLKAVTYDPERKLADIELPEGWNWTNGKTVPTVPKEEYKAEISVDDVNYDYTGVEDYDEEAHTVTRAVPLTVLKAEVAYPEITSKVYNGKKQTASVPDNELYYVHKNDGGTDVGEYDVVLMLTDSNNYKWTDSVLPIKTLKFNITPAKTKAPAPEVKIPALKAVTYDPERKLADIELPEGWNWTNGKTVPTVPKEEYKAEISVDDVKYDYTGVEGYDEEAHTVTRSVPLTVKKAAVTAPKIASKWYNGKRQTASVPKNKLYTVIKNDGGTEVGTYDVLLMLSDSQNYRWPGTASAFKTLKFKIKPLAPGASEDLVDRVIGMSSSERSVTGSRFAPLKLKSTKQGKNNIVLTWNKNKKAVKYVVYGSPCNSKGKVYKPVRFATAKGSRFNVKKIGSAKLKKGTYYKFMVAAFDKNNKAVSISKIVHAVTKGGKYGNHKKVIVKAKVGKKIRTVSKVSIRKGKSLKLKVILKRVYKNKMVSKHVKVRYESGNAKIATVKRGRIKAKAKGKCTVYVYAQNGVYKAIKVTVR